MWSIWLEPTGALNAQLHQIIKRLATSHGGPEFVPHVTLLGGIPCTKEVARERAQKVAARLQPYYITFSKPDQFDRFTKCVFLRCKEAPQTMQAERLAREEFDDVCGEGGAYEPHLSLLYATPQLDDRERMVAELTWELFPAADAQPGLVESGFQATSLSLWHTPLDDQEPLAGQVEAWERVATYQIG